MNSQLIRARGSVSTIREFAEGIHAHLLRGNGELDIEEHGLMLSRLFAIETSAKMARELITDSMKRKLTESKVLEKEKPNEPEQTTR